MKSFLLLGTLLLSTLLPGQIFNRSKAGTLDASPLQVGNTLYAIGSTNINEVDANGEILQSTALPFLNRFKASQTVLPKANGNFLILGSFQSACDLLTNLGYFAYEYSPQLVLIDSTHQEISGLAPIIQALELSQNRYFALTENGYLLFDSSLDTLALVTTPNLAQLTSAVYLGGDEVLIYSQTWASSTPLYNVLNLSTGATNPLNNARSGEITSLTDSTFAIVNLQRGDLYRYQKGNRSYVDSTRLALATGFSASKFQEIQSGFVLRGDSGLSVYNKSDLSLRGSYLAAQPLNSGLLSVSGNQLFFYNQNIYPNVTSYHVLEGAQLNQAPSSIVEGLVLKVKNTSLVSSPDPSGASNLFRVNATWDITLVNNSPEIIDSVRVLWADPSSVPFCTSIYSQLQMPVNGLVPSDSVTISFPMTFFSVYAPNGNASLNFNTVTVMANGKVVSDEGKVTVNTVINNISLAELGPLAELKLFPNPASRTIFIDASQSIEQAEILNLQGQKMRDYGSSSGLQQISVEGLTKGVYWVKLRSEKAETTRRIAVK